MEEPDASRRWRRGPPATLTHHGAWPAWRARPPCRRRTSTWRHRRPSRRSPRATRRRRSPPGPRRGRPPAAVPSPRLGPGALARRTVVNDAHAAVATALSAPRRRPARARRRPAPAGRSTGADARAPTLPGPEEHRYPCSAAARTKEPSAFGHPLGRFGIGGQLHRDRHRLGAGRSTSRTISWPAWAVARQCTRRRASPGRRDGHPEGSPASTRGCVAASPVLVVGTQERRLGRPQRAPRAARPGAAGQPSRPPLQCERSRRRDVEVTDGCTPRRVGTSADELVGRAPVCPRGPTNMSGPGGSTGRTRRRLLRIDPQRDGKAGDAVCLVRCAPEPGPAHDDERAPRAPMSSAPKTRSPSTWTQPEPCVVGDQPPQGDDQHADDQRPRAGPGAPSGSRSGRWDRFEKVSDHRGRLLGVPASASTVRMRWARHATATAFTSSGTT